MKLNGMHGVLRISDHALWHHVDVGLYTFDTWKLDASGPTWTDVYTALKYFDASGATLFEDSGDSLLIGMSAPFSQVFLKKQAAGNFAVGAGAVKIGYYNGVDFTAEPPSVTDDTAISGNTFANNGQVFFDIPIDWVTGANAFYSVLDSDKYYIRIRTTNVPTTPLDADQFVRTDGRFYDVPFAAMDFSGPLQRPLTEESLVLNRNKMGSLAHYIEDADNSIHDPLELSFTCFMDSAIQDQVVQALTCGDPNITGWTGTGVSTKGFSKNDGLNYNPAFADSGKKTVNVQILWDMGAGGYPFGAAFYEVYFPPEQISISEGDEGIVLSATGGVYGVIERIFGFGNRW